MTITLTREEAQSVLDALNSCDETWVYDGEFEQIVDQYDHKLVAKALETLRNRLAQPEPEPVAWTIAGKVTDWSKDFSAYQTQTYVRPVYTAPPQREWQGLTDEEAAKLCHSPIAVIEALLKEKNT